MIRHLDKHEIRRRAEDRRRYAKARLAQPLGSLGNSVHTIHGGSEWEASITFDHCKAALELVCKARRITAAPSPTGTENADE